MTTHHLHGFDITTADDQLLAVKFPQHPPTASFDAAALRELLAFVAHYTPATDHCPPFHQQVYRAMGAIPTGETRTYGQLAAQAGRPAAARATGSACSRNPMPIAVPCHRVVSASGIGAFSGGPGWKAHLLALEKELA